MSSRRLRTVAEGLAAQCQRQVPPPAAADEPATLLGDDELFAFVRDGYLVLPLDEFDDAFHAELHAQSERVWELSGNKGGAAVGNNIFPVLDGLGEVMRGPSVRGALLSVCGPGYSTSAHRFMHESTGQGDQTFHKDGAYRSTVNLRPRVVMIMYVPGGASLEMGPTAVLPGSHVLGLDQGEGWSDFETTQPIVQELKLVAPEGKGQAVLIHYDLVHRGTARLVDRDGALWRPMHKWQFLRTVEPTAPTWAHSGSPAFDALDTMTPVHQSVWSWLCGDAPPMPALTGREAGRVHADREAGDEPVRLAAAHALGQAACHGDASAVEVLAAGLEDEREAVRRVCVHGLAAAGDAATPAALAALGSVRPRTIGYGADVLGECAMSVSAEIVVALASAVGRLEAVIAAATEPLADGKVDPNKSGGGEVGEEFNALQACVQCLGNLAQRVATAAPDQQSVVYAAIVAALLPHVASESDAVRRQAAEATMPLCMVITGSADASASAALVKALWRSLDDSNRYVIASGAEGLTRLLDSGSGLRRSATKAALANLVDKRWCPVTNGTSQF